MSGKGNRINSWYGYGTWEIRRWDEEEQGSDGNETSYSGGSGKRIQLGTVLRQRIGQTSKVELKEVDQKWVGNTCWTVGEYMLL